VDEVVAAGQWAVVWGSGGGVVGGSRTEEHDAASSPSLPYARSLSAKCRWEG
jgi:hypothetical protein